MTTRHSNLITNLALMMRSPVWSVWAVTVLGLMIGLFGHPAGFLLAIVLSAGQAIYFLALDRSLRSISVQVRMAYLALLAICWIPSLRWLYWLPVLGTLALNLVGYCPLARMISLLPWNRTESLSLALLRRTFLSPPVIHRLGLDLHARGCAGGVCELECRVAQVYED